MKKIIKTLPAVAALGLLLGMASCQAEMDAPEFEVPTTDLLANTTIAELKTTFQDKTAQVGLKDSVTNTHYIIKGRVISSDATGNIYKSLVIQDETAALAFSINQSNLYLDYRLGQEVVVDITGLYIGYYRGLQQIGYPGDPYNGDPQLGFMAYDYWLEHAHATGLPSPNTLSTTMNAPEWPADSMYCIDVEIPELAGANLIKMQSQLVELKNVHFRQGGTATYAPKEESVSRALYNDKGDSIIVRNSGYSNFYNQILPEGTGNVRGILSYYGDSWQLLLRGPEDVMIDDMGSQEKPFTIEDALSGKYNGRSGWVEGYIVGSLAAGVANVTGNGDAIFGPYGETENNLLLAETPDVTDITKCVLVDLPQASVLRRYANLLDNPDNYKKKMTVNGKIGQAQNMCAVTNISGDANSFTIEGVTIPGGGGGGTGTYTTVFTGLSSSASSTDFTFDNVKMASALSYVWSWKQNSNGNDYYLNASAFLKSVAYESLSYAISPVIDLTGKTAAKVNFEHNAKFQTTLKSLCGFCVREQGSSEWTEFTIPTWPPAGSWTWTGSGDIDISKFAGKKVQIAFKYGSDSNGADTWEIRNAQVLAQ